MLTRYDGPEFQTECEVELGTPDFGWCPDNYTVKDGQIYRIYISPLSRDANGVYSPASTPSDYKDLSTYGSISYIDGFGTKALSDEAETQFPDGMNYVTDRTHLVAMSINDSKKVNLDVIRALQSGAPVAIWYHTVGGHSIGGNDGIQAQPVQAGIVHESGQTPLSGQVSFRWLNKFDAEIDETTEATPAAFKVVNQPKTLKTKDKS